MKAITQNATYEFSKAKKVIASVVAAALVISFGNFAVAGTTQALADDNTVEVRFKVTATDTTVSVGDQTFGADAEGAYAAAVDADLSFTIDAGENAPAVAVSYMTEGGTPVAHAEMGSKQPSDNLIIGESSLQDDSNDTSDATDEEESPEVEEPQESEAADDSAMYVEQEVTPIPETAAILQEENVEDDQVALASTGDTDAAEEVLEDEFPPMAAAPTAADEVDDESDEEEAVESVTVRADENGNYTIPAAALASAAERDAVIVVTVAAEEGVTSWDELTTALTSEEDVTVKLAADITEGIDEAFNIVEGNKTLDLNGHKISVGTISNNGYLFGVGAGATLTIADTSENAAAQEIKVTESEFNKEKIPNPAKKPGVFKAMVGKTATYDPKSKMLTYFVTRSYPDLPSKGQTEEYIFEHQLDLSGAGAIEIGEANMLVQLTGGTLNIEGGRMTAAGGHMILASDDSTVNMTGGFLVGAQGDNGAAINATGSTVNIGGNAILAGNTATGDSNGGAIFVDNTTLNISGKAILAGNTAGDKVLCEQAENNKLAFAEIRNGGAIYAKENSTITLAGGVISGNTAMADGGGIYLNGTGKKTNKLVIDGDVLITNNQAKNDRSAYHKSGEPTSWTIYGGGGGGIFARDQVIINKGQITGNYAADGGGGMMVSYCSSSQTPPVLKINACVVASNYAGTSEGGGIQARTSYVPTDSDSSNDSYIKSGYITNNMTATEYDYGGGGLFMQQATSNVANESGRITGLVVYHPLVTNNTARGFGGGVAVCTNGTVLSADAAVFGNTALGENATTNPRELGDKWSIDLSKFNQEEKAGILEKWGIPNADTENWDESNYLQIDPSAANDFYSAKGAVVFSSMLGGGSYNWTGYTSGDISSGMVVVTRVGYNDLANKITLSDGTTSGFMNALYNSTNSTLTLHAPSDLHGRIMALGGQLITYDTINIGQSGYPAVQDSGVINKVTHDGTVDASTNTYTLEISNKDAENATLKKDPKKTKRLTVQKPAETTAKTYDIYEIESGELNLDKAAFVQADRYLALKAEPDPGAIKNAYAEAKLFFTGNYSNTNGAGITNNDRIAIGYDFQNPGNPGDSGNSEEPADKFGALQITKSLDKFSAASGTATALFKVTGYVDYETAKNEMSKFVIYENTVGFTFGAGEGMSASEVLTGLPEGYYVIEELYYSGDNFDGTPNRALVEVTGVEKGSEVEAVTVPVFFTNKYKDETYGSGVVNRYALGENGFEYTPISPSPIRPSTEEGR